MEISGHRWPRKASEYTPWNKRERGRPTITWLKGVMTTFMDRAINENACKDVERNVKTAVRNSVNLKTKIGSKMPARKAGGRSKREKR